MNTIRELDAKHKYEVAALKKEFTMQKNSIINARHQESINQLETIEEVEEDKDSDGLHVENNELFDKLEEELKKNLLLEETLRSMRKKYKDEIDSLNVKNTELKQNLNVLEREYKAIKDKHSKRNEKLVEIRNIFHDCNRDKVSNKVEGKDDTIKSKSNNKISISDKENLI